MFKYNTDTKKILFVYLFIFLFMFVLNFFVPTCFGDDIVYTYKWQQNFKLTDFLPYDAVQNLSFIDILESVKNHYISWHGRFASVFLMFFCSWFDKSWFNFFNTLVFVLLIYYIQKIIVLVTDKKFSWKEIFLIFILIWGLFNYGDVTVFFWKIGAVSYLWTSVIALYLINLYLQINKIRYNWIFLFILGFICGSTNENNVPVVILFCIYCIYKNNNRSLWSYSGILGLVIGFIVMTVSPSLSNRVIGECKDLMISSSLSYERYLWLCHIIDKTLQGVSCAWLFEKSTYINNIITIITSFVFWCPLIIYCFYFFKSSKNKEVVSLFLLMSFGSAFCMLFSLYVPYRSMYFPFLYLLISTLIIYKSIDKNDWLNKIHTLCFIILLINFIVTGLSTVYCYNFYWNQFLMFEEYVKIHKNEDVCYVIKDKPKYLFLSKPSMTFSSDFPDWVLNSASVKYRLKSLKFKSK